VIVKSVPLTMFDGRSELQCQRNHGGQTLAQIRARSGFGVTEVICVLAGIGYDDLGDIKEVAAHRVLYAMIALHNRGQRIGESSISKAEAQP
jgi:hypothetical protein